MMHGSLAHGGTRGEEDARRLITYWVQVDFDLHPHGTQMGEEEDLDSYWVLGCFLFASRTAYSHYQDARLS
jgi:hypothetical protein